MILDQKALWSDQELEEELRKSIYCYGNCGPQMSVPGIQAFVARCITEGMVRGYTLARKELSEKENQQ